MPRYLRVDCSSFGEDGKPISSMTGIQVMIPDGDGFEIAKAKALGYIVTELSRYGLHEALSACGIRPDEPVVQINGRPYRPS